MLKQITSAVRFKASVSNNKLLTIVVTSLDKLAYCLKRLKKWCITNGNDSDRVMKVLTDLKRDGYYTFENFLSPDECELIKSEIDNFIIDFPEYKNPSAKADTRFYGADNLSRNIHQFCNNAFLEQVASAYNGVNTKSAFTLAAKMGFQQKNLGSGEGWHRDAILKQFKAIVYLSDVTEKNGPFQFFINSQKALQTIVDIWTAGLRYQQYRITESQATLIHKKNGARLKTLTAKAGTVILVDTSSIHRGKPIEAGERYALTNYYYEIDKINHELYEHFAPIAGIIDSNQNGLNTKLFGKKKA